MGFINNVISTLMGRKGLEVQGERPSQRYRDDRRKADSYSVEAEVSETLADIMLMSSSMPISGDTERAQWLDSIADRLFRTKMKPATVSAFLSGDCIIVPSWNGRTMQNVIVDSTNFEVMKCVGDEVTALAYVVDVYDDGRAKYTLMQAVELVEYTAADGSKAMANRYRMYVVRDSGTDVPLSEFPMWAERYDAEWVVPNVDRLLVGRMRSHTIDPEDPNSVKGAPICFGASDPIEEIHYLLGQMHEEFGLSEKAIVADKRLFQRTWKGDTLETVLPRGKERLFMAVGGNSPDMRMTEWAPDIRYQAYLDALDKQEKLVERAVGVSSGIISEPNDTNYQNMDNVRKSQQKTMGFIDTARGMAEDCLMDLVYAWDVLANWYGIVPMGGYEVSFDWSDEYIESFTDRQSAILAGISVGATDAIDYRMMVLDESPEAARMRVEEIAQNRAENQAFVIEEA